MEKIKRDREINWDQAEKEILRQLLEERLDVVEDKSNDLKMIAKKRAAWEAIRVGMIAAGYNRSTIKIKQQWSRMKIAAKRSRATIKKAVNATGNVISIPVADPVDVLVQGMISEQFEEDTIFIDSNTEVMPAPAAKTVPVDDQEAGLDFASINYCEMISNSPPLITEELEDESSVVIDPPAVTSVQLQKKNLLGKLRQLPKKQVTKGELMATRQRSISESSTQTAELHRLRIEHAKQVLELDKELLLQAKLSTQQMCDKHSLDMQQMRELHEKRMQQLNFKKEFL